MYRARLGVAVRISLITGLSLGGSVAGSVLHVDARAPSGGDGSAWTTAFTDLQDALLMASTNGAIGEIRVAAGVYRPDRGSINRRMTFNMVSGLSLLGGYGGLQSPDPNARDVDVHVTVLDGDLLGDDGPDFENTGENTSHVVTFLECSEITLISGFTIRGGNARNTSGAGVLADSFSRPFFMNCTFERNRGTYGGAASVPCLSAFIDCTFRENMATSLGGAVFNAHKPSSFVRCTFEGNTAVVGGGAVANGNGQPEFMDCRFRANTAEAGGAVVDLYAQTAYATCSFENNMATLQGGALAIVSDSTGDVRDCDFVGNTAGLSGGGIYSGASDLSVSACQFDGNHAPTGGGFACFDSNAVVVGCAFVENVADYGGGLSYSGLRVRGADGAEPRADTSSLEVEACGFTSNIARAGGGIHVDFGVFPRISNCQLEGNVATSHGGGLNNLGHARLDGCAFVGNSAGARGGGMANAYDARPIVSRCSFVGNRSALDGGGVSNDVGAAPAIFNSVFRGNIAERHGAMMNNFGSAELANCLLEANVAGGRGGGLHEAGFGHSTLTNCTLAFNKAGEDGAAIWHESTPITAVRNSIIWTSVSSDSESPIEARSPVSVRHSLVQTGWGSPADANLDADPRFIDPDRGNFRLRPGSPCIDAGDSFSLPADVADLDADGNTIEPLPFDLDGLPRTRNDAGSPDAAPSGSRLEPADVGAYEFQGLTGDLDGDGLYDSRDLRAFIDCMQPAVSAGVSHGDGAEPTNCSAAADFDADGDVDLGDFAVLQRAIAP